MTEAQTKTCQNCKAQFTIEPEDFQFYAKVNVPPPTFCWLCRAQRRMAWRNERSLFKRKSDFSGKDIFSAFAPDAPVKVYENEVWITDQWDPMTYGRDYDFSKGFFEQFSDLLRTVPLKNRNVVNGGPGSDYCNNFTDPKNCYLTFNGKGAEDCMYGNGFTFSKSCVDTSHVGKCERCYEGFWLTSCSNTFFSSQCESSFNLMFCRDCVGSNDCFGCVGLKNKSYCIFNEQYSKEDYEQKIKEFNLSSYSALEHMRARVAEFWLKFPLRFMIGSQNQNVSGNYIEHSKNVAQSFLVRESENVKYSQYMQELPGSKDTYDYTAWGDSNELVYECAACGIGTHQVKFSYNVQQDTKNVEYSYMCSGCSDVFGCVALKKKQYCILNKQYSKEEYEALLPKIKKQMDEIPYTDKQGRVYRYGEFFPIELSPFAYNETLAQEYFPLTKEEALAAGYTWRDPIERTYVPTKKAIDLPDSITTVPDSITNETIGCAHEGKCKDQCTIAFRIIPDELTFYRANNIPLPRLCPGCRHYRRIAQRSRLHVYERQCQCAGTVSENEVYKNQTPHFHGEGACPNTFETSYGPNRPEFLYCESCYNSEVA